MEVELKECEIQGSCVEWFRANFPEWLIFSVPNEACFKRKQYFDSLGLLNGVSDTIAVKEGEVLFIEFKRDGGKQSNEQVNFQQKVEALGHRYYVIKNLDDFKEIWIN